MALQSCVRKNKEKRVFLWFFAHLFVTLHKQNLKTMKYSKTDMSEKDIEGKKILERADKITNRLFKALYSEEDGDVIDYPTLMCALTKFSATVLLAVQELGERIDVEDDFIKTVKEVKATMGKDMKVQKIKEERDQIKLRIKENEMKIKYIEMKIKENEMKINEMKQKRDEALLRMSAQYKDKLN